MTLTPSLWKLVERGETCPFEDCAFTVAFFEQKEANKAAAAAALLKENTGNGGGDLGGAVGGVDAAQAGPAGGVGGGKQETMVVKGEAGASGGLSGVVVEDKETKSRCRHFHTLCGCRHTRGVLKGRLFQVGACVSGVGYRRWFATGWVSGIWL